MALVIYNTKTRKKEPLEPLNPPKVLWYNCGPTVYDYFHIGNARNFIVVDTIRRYLEYRGYIVKFVQNITDIEDKIIKRAWEDKTTSRAVARKFSEYYFQQADLLNIRRADVNPKATDTISQIIALIKKLIEKENAYIRDGDVFFRIKSFPDYGKLSGKNIEELMEGARVEVDPRKESPVDFALWKSSKPGEPSWESPWGPGRPGWHIECSAMVFTHLAESIDIHSGGVDLIFPHHENEIAQSESATGKPFVRYWLHNGFLNINSQKMSKSLGNFFTINEVLENFDPMTIRYFLISAHYRHPLDYSDANLTEAESVVKRIKDTIESTEQLLDQLEYFQEPDQSDIEKNMKLRDAFVEVMDDDFNTAKALGVIFDTISEINSIRNEIFKLAENKKSPSLYGRLNLNLNLLKEFLSVLGLDKIISSETLLSIPKNSSKSEIAIDKLIQLLINLRQDCRKEKLYHISDKIRAELAEIGIALEDLPQGTIWKKK